jgi:arginase
MKVRLVEVPYDSGRMRFRMGAGPRHLIEHGVAHMLAERGHDVVTQTITLDADSLAEVASAFALDRLLALAAEDAQSQGQFPVLLAGNCGRSLGMIAGLGASDAGLVWFDAHGDLNTPETTTSGFLDGMSLATLTGRCWRSLSSSVPGFAPLPDSHVVLVGARALDNAEAELLADSDLTPITSHAIRRSNIVDALAPALRDLHARTARVYLHVDLDVLDSAEATVNQFSTSDGLTVKQLLAAIRRIGEQFEVVGGTLSSYDPACDVNGAAREAALKVIDALVGAAAEKRKV